MVPVYILHNRELGYYSCYICNEFKMKTISFLLVGVALVAHWCSSQNIEDLGSPSNVSREDSARSRFLKSDDLQLIIMTESLYDEGGRLRSYSEMIGPSRDGGDAANDSFEVLEIESLYDEGGRLRSYSEIIGPLRDGGDAANDSFEVLEIEYLYDDGGRLRNYSEMIGPSRDGGDATNHSFEVLEIESLYDEDGRLRSYSEMIGPSRDGGDAANHSFEVPEIESQEAIDSSPPIKPTNLTFEGVTPPV